jgi:hypothetical protein
MKFNHRSKIDLMLKIKTVETHEVLPLMGAQDISDVRKVVKHCCKTPLKKLRHSEVEHIYLELLSDILKNNGINSRVWYTPGKDVITKEYRFKEPPEYKDLVDLILCFEYYNPKTETYHKNSHMTITSAQKDKYLKALKEDKLVGHSNIMVDGVPMKKSAFIDFFTKWRNQ